MKTERVEIVQVIVPGLWSGRNFMMALRGMAWRQDAQSDDARVLELPWLFNPFLRPDWTFAAERRAYAAQVADLAASRTPVVLIGHSYGAQHVLDMVTQRTLNVQAVVLLAPPLGRGWWLACGWRIVKFVVLQVLGRRRGNLVVNAHEEGALAEFIARLRVFPRAGVNVFGLLAQVVSGGLQTWRGYGLKTVTAQAVPTLVVWSEGDRLVPAGKVVPEGVAEVRLQADGHFLFLGKQETWKRIEQWLATTLQEHATDQPTEHEAPARVRAA